MYYVVGLGFSKSLVSKHGFPDSTAEKISNHSTEIRRPRAHDATD